jgi:hypothetical protein
VVLMGSSILWDIMPCASLKVDRNFGETYGFPDTENGATCSSEMSVHFQQTSRRYTSEDTSFETYKEFGSYIKEQDRRSGGPHRSERLGKEKILDPTGTRTPTPRSSSS